MSFKDYDGNLFGMILFRLESLETKRKKIIFNANQKKNIKITKSSRAIFSMDY